MGWCTAYGCSNNTSNCEISFFLFPLKNKELLKKWLLKIKRKNFLPTKFSKICHSHFEDSCFETAAIPEFLSSIGYKFKTKRRLKPDAIPTIFGFNEPNDVKKKLCRSTTINKRNKKEIVENLLEYTSSLQVESPMKNEIIPVESLPVSSYDIRNILINTSTRTQLKCWNIYCQTEMPPALKTKRLQTDLIRTVSKAIQTDDVISYIKKDTGSQCSLIKATQEPKTEFDIHHDDK